MRLLERTRQTVEIPDVSVTSHYEDGDPKQMSALNLDHAWVEAPCPRCGYGVEIQLADARTQVWRWCPCCRVLIRFMEPDGSVSGSIAGAEEAMRSLEETLRKAFG